MIGLTLRRPAWFSGRSSALLWCGWLALAGCAAGSEELEAGESSSSGTPSPASTGGGSTPGDGGSTGADASSGSDGDESTTAATGCGDTLAHGAAIRDVSFFQVVEVATLAGEAPIESADRTAPLVADRAAVARVRLETGAGWTPRMLGVRVAVTTAAGEVLATEDRVVNGSDADQPDAGFVVDVPASALQPGAAYSVSLVECEAGFEDGGSSEGARYPASGVDELEVVPTGPIKIHLVPFEVGGFVPETSQTVLDGFRDAVLAVYPATDVQITVADVVADQNGGAVDMGDLLVRLGERQEQQDQAAPDIYYYGLVTGAATRDEFCGTCPTGTSESGGGSRAGFSVGAAFADQKSEDTLIHELGHMHGLLHAPCGDPDLLDEQFPHADAALGVEGFDSRTATFVPADHKDLMAYCYPRWVSDYHYRKMIEWVQLAQTWTRSEGPMRQTRQQFVCP